MSQTLSQKNLGSEQGSRGLTSNFVSGHFTSSSPKGSSQLGSITFATGEHSRIGELLHTTNPLLKTCTGISDCTCIYGICQLLLAHI